MKQMQAWGTLGLVFLAATGLGQTSAAQQQLLKGKALAAEAFNTWNEQAFLEARGIFERLLSHQPVRKLAHYYIGYVDYRLGTLSMQQQPEKAAAYLDDGITHLEAAVALDAKFAEALALLASCYGQAIGVAPERDMSSGLAISYGMNAQTLMAAALKQAPDNPRVLLLDGLSLYFTPPGFGGSKERALQRFETAARRFETFKPQDARQPQWGAAEVYAWIGLARQEKGELELARDAFKKALARHPEFRWVKFQLLPAVEKRLAQSNQK